jgi:hypothetical protein
MFKLEHERMSRPRHNDPGGPHLSRPTAYEDLMDLPADHLQFLYLEAHANVSELDKRVHREYRRRVPDHARIRQLNSRLAYERDLRETYKLFWDTARDVIASEHGTEDTARSTVSTLSVSSRNLSEAQLTQLRGSTAQAAKVAPEVANMSLTALFANLDGDSSSGSTETPTHT